MAIGHQHRLITPASGEVRTVLSHDETAAGGWFCLDGHLWLRKIAALSATTMFAKGGDPKLRETAEITFDLQTLRIVSSGPAPVSWARVPEAQQLIDRVAGAIDKALTPAIPAPSGPLPDTIATLGNVSLPELAWPKSGAETQTWIERLLGRLFAWPGNELRTEKARSIHRARNLALLQFETQVGALAPEAGLRGPSVPNECHVRFFQRLVGLVQPMDLEVILIVAPDGTSVELEVSQAGRIDLLAGVSVLHRTSNGLDVARLDGAAREQAIAGYLLARMVVLARCLEASWAGPKPSFSVTLTLAKLPGTLRACLTVESQGWGFGLAELALQLPGLPTVMPRGVTLRMLPVDPAAQPKSGPWGAPPEDVPARAEPKFARKADSPERPEPVILARLVPVEPDLSGQTPATTVVATFGWISPGQSAQVQGRDVGGMIYLGKPPSEGPHRQLSKAYIDPTRPVARPVQPPELPYWPSYSDLSPQARWAYLDWLAGPRNSGDLGFMFLYFYGLERRFFLDRPLRAERLLLVAEVERLLSAFGSEYSAQRYLGGFLDHAGAVLYPEGPSEPDFTRTGYELPLQLKLALGRRVATDVALSADWMLAWLMHHPGHRLRAPAQRAFPEFRALFGILFDDLYPQGLKIRRPRKSLEAEYRAASGISVTDLTDDLGDVPDITNSEKPVEIAAEIAGRAMQALDRFSRLLGRDAEARQSLAAYLALPRRLWPIFPNAGAAALRDWGKGVIASGGFAPLGEVLTRLGRGTDAGKSALVDVADSLAALGLGMAPDPRFGLRRPKPDEDVVLFALPEGAEPLEEASPEYLVLQTALAMGSFIAHADGGVVDQERAELLRRIAASAELSALERAHLSAALEWSLAVPPDLALLGRRLKDAEVGARQELAQLALVVAASDGVIDPREIAAVERLYRALGLDSSGIYTALHGLVTGIEPLTVRAGQPGAGHAIPPRPHDAGPRLILDRDRIAAVMVDTAQVATFLEEQLGDMLAKAPPKEPPAPLPVGFGGLDGVHVAFLADLMSREHWSEADFVALATQHRLMPGGALEAINEWSFDHLGDMMVEDHEGYTLNRDLVAVVQQGQL